jgi:hypothetical protein
MSAATSATYRGIEGSDVSFLAVSLMVSSIVYSLPKFLVVEDYNLPPLLEVDLWRLALLISPPSVLFDLVRSAEAGLRVLTDGCSTYKMLR